MGLSGDVLHHTAGCEGWLDPARQAVLARVVSEVHATGHANSQRIIAGHRASLVRLHGGGQALGSPSGLRPEAFLITIRAASNRDPFTRLTPRQREIATIAISGATAAEIGRATGTSEATVRVHLRGIYSRLGVGTRVELANLVNSGRPRTRRQRERAAT